jgi:hypothetical protein
MLIVLFILVSKPCWVALAMPRQRSSTDVAALVATGAHAVVPVSMADLHAVH